MHRPELQGGRGDISDNTVGRPPQDDEPAEIGGTAHGCRQLIPARRHRTALRHTAADDRVIASTERLIAIAPIGHSAQTRSSNGQRRPIPQ